MVVWDETSVMEDSWSLSEAHTEASSVTRGATLDATLASVNATDYTILVRFNSDSRDKSYRNNVFSSRNIVLGRLYAQGTPRPYRVSQGRSRSLRDRLGNFSKSVVRTVVVRVNSDWSVPVRTPACFCRGGVDM